MLCEKPMATRVADAEEMLATAARNDRLLLVLHPWRHHPAVIALRDAIVAGELGRVVRTHGYGVHAGWGPGGWFTDPVLPAAARSSTWASTRSTPRASCSASPTPCACGRRSRPRTAATTSTTTASC